MIRNVAKVSQFIWKHPANRGKRLSTLSRAICWQVAKRVTGKPWVFALPGGMKIKCYPDSHPGSIALYTNGMHDLDEMIFMKRYLRPSDRFLDIGANIGVYSFFAAPLIGPDGTIDAFEPGDPAFERFQENIALNRLENRISLHKKAVSAEDGEVQFVIGHDATNRIADDRAATTDIMRLPCVALDNHFADTAYALGKIDTEGAEPLVLRGAEKMLRSANPPVWILEINPRGLAGHGFSVDSFREWMSAREFDLAAYNSRENSFSTDPASYCDAPNAFAVARSKRDFVLDRVGATWVNNG
ncbi:MAG: FkbM family methyltransferase [Phycisphaerae bacterium]